GLLILSDAFLKNYVRDSSFLHLNPYWLAIAFVILSFCICYLFYYFRGCSEGFQPAETKRREQDAGATFEYLLVAVIIFLGIFLRFWKLSTLFVGAWSDEGANGVDAIAIRYFGDHPVFLNWYAGREALHAYLISAFTVPFGYTIFAVRAV